MKVHEALKRASSFLQTKGREPRAAEILLIHHLGVSRTKFFGMMTDELSAAVFDLYWEDVEAHAKGVPVQHLTGIEEFYGRVFSVSRDVLIPRPETEELVAFVLDRIDKIFPGNGSLNVVDVGTGSGAIATTLALENERLRVSAVDLSEAALAVAKANANRLGATVSFWRGDLLAPFLENGQKVDVIVSNPPYIPEEDEAELDDVVRDHEPHLALFGGKDGYSVYRRLIEQIPNALKEPGLVAFEVGVGQSEVVVSMLRERLPHAGKIVIEKDINGKERIVAALISR